MVFVKFTLGEIERNAVDERFVFDGVVDVSELETMNNDIRYIDSVHVDGVCTLQGERIIFSFTIKGEATLPCARTLVDVSYPIDIQVTEVFTTSPYYSEEDEKNEIHPVDGEVLDLTPYIMENILLEIPYRVFSKDAEAQENALKKGEGWEFFTEETYEKPIDPRMKKLGALLKDRHEKDK